MATRHINDLNIVGSGSQKRVETKDMTQDTPEVTVKYPRPSNGLNSEEKARFASFAQKGLAHLGFDTYGLRAFVRKAWDQAEQDAQPQDPCAGKTVEIDGKQYTLTPVEG